MWIRLACGKKIWCPHERITSETQKIVDRKPDLVLTIGTPATRYAKDKIIAAGIPVVFTGVAIPTAAGCKSQTESGQGFTGATLYMDMNSVVKIIRLAFPKIKTLGVIHSEDENAVEQVAQLKKSTPSVGLKVISRQIDKNAHITPVAEEVMNQGIEGTIIPLDTYYGMRNDEATNELRELNNKWKKPGIFVCVLEVARCNTLHRCRFQLHRLALGYAGSQNPEGGCKTGEPSHHAAGRPRHYGGHKGNETAWYRVTTAYLSACKICGVKTVESEGIRSFSLMVTCTV